MLQYVIRRLLYSIVVLIAASMLVFTFVAKTGDPLAALRLNPRISQQSVQNIKDRKHLDDPIWKRYGYWARDAVTNGFGTTILGDKPILPDLWRVMKHTLQLVIIAELLAILIAVGIGVYSALRQYSVFDYSATTFSFIGLAMPVFWFALMLQVGVVYVYQWTGYNIFPVASLSSIDPGRGRSLLDRSGAPPRAADHRPHGREHRDVLAVHARLDARGRELGLRSNRAGQGAQRAEGHHEARLPQRPDPARHARSRSTSAHCSAGRSRRRRCSRSTGWACTSSRPSAATTPTRSWRG